MFEKSSKRIMFAVTLSSIVFQVVRSVKTGRLIILQFYITYFCHLIRFFHSYLSTTSIRENMGGLNQIDKYFNRYLYYKLS